MPKNKPPGRPARSRQQTKLLPANKSKLLRERFYNVWFYISIAIILLQFAYSYRPRVAIESEVAVNNSDPLSTLFQIVNTGPLHVNNIRITCIFSTSSVSNIAVESTVLSQQDGIATGSGPIVRLDSGTSATRDCGAGSSSRLVHIPPYDPMSLRLDIMADFDWPFIPIPDDLKTHFTVRQLSDGRTILVPDVEH